MKTESYQVREGKKLSLKEYNPNETAGVSKEEAAVRKPQLQLHLVKLQERLHAKEKQSLLVVLQTRDAGGKDGTIKHVFTGLNPQGVNVTGFKEPTPLELSHDFLWRVHAHTPVAGMIGVFNRSYYEDVLVTRVHGEVDKQEVERRYEEIRAFEISLQNRGTRILKLHLNISKDEQKKRFQDRLDDPEKHWKFSQNDLNERALWDDYTKAYQDTLSATSTATAPWYIIPANHKWFRNDLIMHILLETPNDMNPQFPKVDFDPSKIIID
ncbi:polyphosphate kinase 2 family protein [Deinococcus detaillensis]|uniref:Polyphosphate kinase 2 family protein n=1 Tax=Deinococcus detaillensis TaxID=2592048 RepID=A0A553UE47_9DEIO|nr:polyphosphate kinase 2 family protein [Deinococcus detaillensis]TSA78497.1 polyphosphate kinase 2 family protein [Deinococcus detaillensis]